MRFCRFPSGRMRRWLVALCAPAMFSAFPVQAQQFPTKPQVAAAEFGVLVPDQGKDFERRQPAPARERDRDK